MSSTSPRDTVAEPPTQTESTDTAKSLLPDTTLYRPATLSLALPTDAADQSDTITVNLSVAQGRLTLGTSSGTSLSFTGTQTAVDASLAAVSYAPNSEFEGSDTLTFSATTSDTATGLPTSTARRCRSC